MRTDGRGKRHNKRPCPSHTSAELSSYMRCDFRGRTQCSVCCDATMYLLLRYLQQPSIHCATEYVPVSSHRTYKGAISLSRLNESQRYRRASSRASSKAERDGVLSCGLGAQTICSVSSACRGKSVETLQKHSRNSKHRNRRSLAPDNTSWRRADWNKKLHCVQERRSPNRPATITNYHQYVL
jgi:hypothetical protein